MCSIFDLPIEVLIFHIFTALDAIDLLRLGQVSKAGCDALSHRCLWEDAFRVTCRDAKVFEPSFGPIEALDLQALKKGAIGPTLLLRSLTRNEELHPVRELLLHFPAEARLNGTPRISNRSHLVPGGRYLFGCSNAKLGLWDLGPPYTRVGTQHGAELLDVFDFTAQDSRFELHGISAPLPHSGRFLRFTAYLDHSQDYTFQHICVYEVGPLPENTKIRRLAHLELRFGAWLETWWLSENKVYLFGRDSFAVWDFIDSRLASWPIESNGRSSWYMDNHDDRMVILKNDGVYTWEIPPLEPIKAPFVLEAPVDGAVPRNPSYLEYPGGQLVDEGGTAEILMPQWYRESNQIPFQIDLVDRRLPPGVSTMVQVRFDIRSQRVDVTRCPKVSLFSPLLGANSTFAYSRCGEMQFIAGYCSVAGCALEMIASANSWETNVGSRFREDQNSEAHATLLEPQIFCSFSGRYAYVCNEGHDDNKGITLTDYHNRIHVDYLL